MSQKNLVQLSSMDSKLMIGSQKLNEIINSTNYFGNKRGIGYEEEVSTSTGVAPNFFKSIT